LIFKSDFDVNNVADHFMLCVVARLKDSKIKNRKFKFV
jgi:hypothetical protein